MIFRNPCGLACGTQEFGEWPTEVAEFRVQSLFELTNSKPTKLAL